MENRRPLHLPALSLLALLAGCGGDATIGGQSPSTVDRPTTPQQPLEIEESDLYKLDGTTLYVQNRTTGLNVVDVAEAAHPQRLGIAPVVGGVGSEIYVPSPGQVAVLLTERSADCRALPGLTSGAAAATSAELALVDASDRASPEILGRYCLPSSVTASRMVGSALYLVLDARPATGTSQVASLVVSVSLADLAAPRVIAQREIAAAADEIHLSESTLAVASASGVGTLLSFFDIGGSGRLDRAGEISVPGTPAGRFHMDLRGAHFRIVTRTSNASRLTVIDLSTRSAPKIIGALDGIGAAENLYATRFEDDRAYVVTFPEIVRWDSRDPLWVIDLKDPTKPAILGELIVPGWSEFLFPRGDRVVAVGRAVDNVSFGVTLFDVADPHNPITLDQYTIGATSTSEAQVDHRGVTILERMGDSGQPALVVPYAEVTRSSEGGRTSCRVRNRLQLIDLERDRMPTRGRIDLKGTARRSFLVGDLLYGLSDYEVKAIDVSDRDAPLELAQVTVADDATLRTTTQEICFGTTDSIGFLDDGPSGCAAAGPGASASTALGVVVAMLVLALRRRRGSSAASCVAALVLLGAAPAWAQTACDPGAPDCVRTLDAPPSQVPPPATLPPQANDAERPSLAQQLRYTPQLDDRERPRPVVVEKRRVGLGIGGLTLFAATWLTTAGAGYIADENLLAIPLFGPLVYLGKYRERFDCSNTDPETFVSCRSENAGDRMVYGALALDTLVQASGLVMAGLGFGLKKKTTTVTFLPQTGMQRIGLAAVGTF